MRINSRYYWLAIMILSLISSCGDIPTCLDVETSLVKINFIDESGTEKPITLRSLTAIGNEMGFLEYADTTLSNFQLSLNPGSTTTTFILEQETVTDTLALTYEVIAKLISPECGLDAAFTKLDTAFTTYNQLEIVNMSIHKEVTVNIEITL